MQTDRDWKTGCYNTDCPGFVPFTYDLHAGMVVDQLSSYGQIDASLTFQIVKVCHVDPQSPHVHYVNLHSAMCLWHAYIQDERPLIGGDWWLYHVYGPGRFPVGHWPASMFTTMSRHATAAAWYGAVGFERRGDDLPPMGSGRGPREGRTRAAYFADISIMVDGTAAPLDDPSLTRVTAMLNTKRCYEVAMDAGGGNNFFYGGPASDSCV